MDNEFVITNGVLEQYNGSGGEVVIPDGVKKIGDNVFLTRFDVFGIIIPNSVTEVGANACACCGIKSLTIPGSVSEMKRNSFFSNVCMTEVKVCEGVREIPDFAFASCDRLEKVTLPDSLTKLGKGVFDDAKAASVTYRGKTYTAANMGELYDAVNNQSAAENTGSVSVAAPAAAAEAPEPKAEFEIENKVLKKYNGSGDSAVIPEGVVEIGEFAFENHFELLSVTIPESVVKIADSAFEGCSGLREINFPDSVAEIGKNCFEGCLKLYKLILPPKLTEIPYCAFRNCGIESVKFPDGLKVIGPDAFYGCDSAVFTMVDLPQSVTKIEAGAFAYCDNLIYAKCPAGTEIADTAFFGCDMLQTNINAAAGNVSDETDAAPEEYDPKIFEIENSVLKSYNGLYMRGTPNVIVPRGVTEIYDRAFFGALNIESVTLPHGVTIIGANAFEMCKKLETIKIPGTVTEIEEDTFHCCVKLNNIDIPNGLKVIKSQTFGECKSLKSVTLPDSLNVIEKKAFYESGLTSIVIPKSVTRIGERAFYECQELTSVSMTDSVAEIGSYAFADCTALSDVTLSSSLVVIPDGMFNNCVELKSITIPNSVKRIGTAFSGCTALESVSIPDNVRKIERTAFLYCEKISVSYKGKVYTQSNIKELYNLF